VARNLLRDHPEERRTGHPNACGDARGWLCDLATDPLCESDRIAAVTGHRHDELLTADAPYGGIAGAGATEDVADGDQGLVARGVSRGVVDPFEVVQINHHDRQMSPAVVT
jgi:hypothetical protein